MLSHTEHTFIASRCSIFRLTVAHSSRSRNSSFEQLCITSSHLFRALSRVHRVHINRYQSISNNARSHRRSYRSVPLPHRVRVLAPFASKTLSALCLLQVSHRSLFCVFPVLTAHHCDCTRPCSALHRYVRTLDTESTFRHAPLYLLLMSFRVCTQVMFGFTTVAVSYCDMHCSPSAHIYRT